MQDNVLTSNDHITVLSTNGPSSKKSGECQLSSSSSSSSSSKVKHKQDQNMLGSLCSLFISEYFTIDMAMEYLNKKEEAGSVDFLINLLFKDKFISHSFFYLPQLCTLLRLKANNESIERFIIDQSTSSIKFAACATWLFNSYSDDDRSFYLRMIEKIETSIINGKKSRGELSDKEYFNKGDKLEYFDRTIKLYEKLQSLCEKLKNIQTKPETLKKERNELLVKGLNAFNRTCQRMLLNKAKTNASFSNFGFALPFESKDKEEQVIVNFLPKYSFCFSTKARVPVKITVECIDSNETQVVEEQLEDNEQAEEDHKEIDLNGNELQPMDDFKLKMNKEEEQIKAKAIIDAVKYENEHPESTNHQQSALTNQIAEATVLTMNTFTDLPNPFEVSWEATERNIKEHSRYRRFSSLAIKSFLAKANDDLRQELMTMQLIKKFLQIFKEAGIPLHLHPYEIIITSKSSGLIEFIPDTISLDALKKMLPPKCQLSKFYRTHFRSNFFRAQKNFCESLASYSLVSYLLNIKDRHNGNILIDSKGYLIHIDFGFILGISPGGNLNFENAPFKMTKEYIRLLDGEGSEVFMYFKSIFLRGLLEARKHADMLINIVETMSRGTKMPCFSYGAPKEVVSAFKERFLFGKTDNDIIAIVDDLIYRACNSWRTAQYDIFQKLTNGIMP